MAIGLAAMTLAALTAAPPGVQRLHHDLAGGWRLTRVVDRPANATRFALTDRAGRELAAWAGPPPGPHDADFFARRTRGDRLLVACLEAESMGMAVASWACVAVTPGRAPIRWSSADLGPDAFAEDARGPRVLATEWRTPEETGRRSLHLVGSWYRLGGDGLVPDRGRPPRARPLLYTFEAERIADLGRPGHPAVARWLRPAKAPRLAGREIRLADLRPRRPGVVADVAAGPGEGAWTLTFRPDGGGAPRRLVVGDLGAAPDGATALWRVVERGRVMPPAYRPADPAAAWRGRHGFLDEREGRAALWLR